MKISVRKSKGSMTIRFTASPKGDEGVDLRDVVLAAAKGNNGGLNPGKMIAALGDRGYTATNLEERAGCYIEATLEKGGQ